MNSKEPLRVAVIGLGVGEALAQACLNHPGAALHAICDFSPETLNRKKQLFPEVPYLYENAEQVFENPEIDLVVVASYDDYHFSQICTAIGSGKHVFVEKPFCQKREEAETIFQLLQQNPDVKVSSNLILRRSPRFLDLKQRILSRALGDIYYLDADYNYGRIHKVTEGWRVEQEFYSATYGGGIHLIDLFLWLLNERVVRVSAMGNNITTAGSKFKHRDLVAALLEFENGATAKITSNLSCVYPHFHKFCVYGTQATFENALPEALLYENRDPEIAPRSIGTAYPGVHKGDLLGNFINYLFDKEELEVGPKDIFDVMDVCFAVEKSLNSKNVEVVQYLNG